MEISDNIFYFGSQKKNIVSLEEPLFSYLISVKIILYHILSDYVYFRY
jgi:hypothetical protein